MDTFVTVLNSNNPAIVAVAKTLLDNAGLAFIEKNPQRLYSRTELLVDSEHKQDALLILNDLRQDQNYNLNI